MLDTDGLNIPMTAPPPAAATPATDSSSPASAVRVSVIVPVFRPGAGFDDLIRSLDRQTCGQDAFEVLLCDDGSGPETEERLRRVAEGRRNVRVLTLEHTGWPGTPRNHGIDAAVGTYVFFADQDDRLFENALQDMCDHADAWSSDVLVGKVVGVGRAIPRRIFRRDVPRAELGRDPLLELLTPHKLFRTSFIRENAIRFPDGRVRLEDHLFVMRAYFCADTISILASRPCYAWLKNEGSASSSRIDPDTYFPHLDLVLELVEEHTTAGDHRDVLLRHWYRSKILNRLASHRLLAYPDDYRTRFFDTVEPLVRRRFGAGVDAGLPFPLRIRSALLAAGRRDDLVRFAEFDTALECRAELVKAAWQPNGKLRVVVRVRVLRGETDELVFEHEHEHDAAGDAPPALWRPPADVPISDLGVETLDAQRDLADDQVTFHLVDGESVRRFPGRPARRLDPATATIEPLSVFPWGDRGAGGRIEVRVRHAGWRFTTFLHADSTVIDGIGSSPLRAGRRCRLVRYEDGTVGLVRQWPRGLVRDVIARVLRRAGRWRAQFRRRLRRS